MKLTPRFLSLLALSALMTSNTLSAETSQKQQAFLELQGPALLTPKFCAPPSPGVSPFDSTIYDGKGNLCTAEICDHVLYRCKTEVPQAAVYTEVGLPESEVDCAGAPLKYIAMTLGGVGVRLRFNENVCLGGVSNRPRGVLVTFAGGGGNAWRDAKTNDGNFGNYVGRDPDGDNSADDPDYRAMERQGIRVVAPRWEDGVKQDVDVYFDLPTDSFTGFSSRVINLPHSWRMIRKRPASLVQFVASQLTPPEAKLGVAGTSGGSVETSSLLFYGVSRKVDYLGLHGGGGGYADMPKQCGAEKTNLRVSRETGSLCDQGESCGPKYARPVAPYPLRINYDYPRMTDHCFSKEGAESLVDDSILNLSSPANRPGYVGFIANGVSDQLMVLWPMGAVQSYLKQKGLRTNWIYSEEGQHGQCMESGHPSFVHFRNQIRSAFGF